MVKLYGHFRRVGLWAKTGDLERFESVVGDNGLIGGIALGARGDIIETIKKFHILVAR